MSINENKMAQILSVKRRVGPLSLSTRNWSVNSLSELLLHPAHSLGKNICSDPGSPVGLAGMVLITIGKPEFSGAWLEYQAGLGQFPSPSEGQMGISLSLSC